MGRWCCKPFENLLSCAGEKGMSVVARRDEHHRDFVLQARPFERDVVEKYSCVDPATGHHGWPAMYDSRGLPVPFVIFLQLPLTHCLSCGADLSAFIEKNAEEFDRLATAMSRFAKS